MTDPTQSTPSEPQPMKPLHDYQQRVVDEKTELDNRRAKLSEFIASNPAFQKLPIPEQVRMKDQRAAMAEYSAILGERIAAF